MIYIYQNLQLGITSSKKPKLKIEEDNKYEDFKINDETDIAYKMKNIITKRKLQTKIIRYRKYRIEIDRYNYFREQIMLYFPWRNEESDFFFKNIEDLFTVKSPLFILLGALMF